MSNKKVLAILGSPHPTGTTATMLNYAVVSAQKAGCEVFAINLYEKQIGYCKGCRTCLDTGKCIQQDDMLEVSQLLKDCDAVMLASPIYWANVSAPVKNFFDRSLGIAIENTDTYPKPRLHGKTYMLLTACNTSPLFSWISGQSRGTIGSMDNFFRLAGMKCNGKFVCTGTGNRVGLPQSLIKRLERCWK